MSLVLTIRFCRISTLVSDEDLKDLIEKLGERSGDDTEIWEDVIQKSNPRVSYTAKCCKPQVTAKASTLKCLKLR